MRSIPGLASDGQTVLEKTKLCSDDANNDRSKVMAIPYLTVWVRWTTKNPELLHFKAGFN